MSKFVIFMMWFVKTYFPILLIYYIITRLIMAIYLRCLYYDKWFAVLVPLGHLYCKYELGAVSPWLLVPTAILSILAIYTYDLIFLIVAFICSLVCEHLYAKVFIDGFNTYIWTYIPISKYLFMLKEVIAYAGDDTRR